MNAYITFYGGKGGKQSIRRSVEVLHLADGSHRFRLDLNDIPVRASYAEVEIEGVEEDVLRDENGNPIQQFVIGRLDGVSLEDALRGIPGGTYNRLAFPAGVPE